MGFFNLLTAFVLLINFFLLLPQLGSAQLKQNYYANTCPNVEKIVREAVNAKFKQTFTTVPGTLRLFFHDCFVQGCDASIIIVSTPNNQAEKDHPDNLSIAGDGYDTVIQAKAAVDAVGSCKNKVSCADILVMATRDVVALGGGPSYAVELGRLDGLSSTSTSVAGKLPKSDFNLDQLNSMFAANGLSQTDMVALSGAHTLGFTFCKQFENRIYNFSKTNPIDPTLNKTYAAQLQAMCPKDVDPSAAFGIDPYTPRKFDNLYYKGLQQGMGIFKSDQVLFTDSRSNPTVNTWASNSAAFEQAFISAMTKLGRVGVKTGSAGNVRRDCAVFN